MDCDLKQVVVNILRIFYGCFYRRMIVDGVVWRARTFQWSRLVVKLMGNE